MLQRPDDRSAIDAKPALAYRPEIEGMRAIAVLGVLLFHAGFPAFAGGYAGVDAGYWDIDSAVNRCCTSGRCRSRNNFICSGRRCCCLRRARKAAGAPGLCWWRRLVLQACSPLMQDAYAVEALSERATNKCRTGQREWRDRIEAENPRLVILSSFWMYGISKSYPARDIGDESIAMPDLAESRARFERKIFETVEWLTGSGRKVIIIGSTMLVDRSPADCYNRPKFLGSRECEKLNVVSDPEAQAWLSAFFRKLATGRNDVLYVDVASALCSIKPCPLGENGTSLYLDRHHLTPYGAMWVQHRAFGPLTRFVK